MAGEENRQLREERDEARERCMVAEALIEPMKDQLADAEQDALNQAADAVDAEFTSGMFVAEIFESWLRERAKAVSGQ